MPFVIGSSDAKDSIELGSRSHCSARDVFHATLLTLLLFSRPSGGLRITVMHHYRKYTCDVTGLVSRNTDCRRYEGRRCLKMCQTFLQYYL
jgi:hypothetical protein